MQQTLRRFVKLMVGYSPVTLLGPLSSIILIPLYTRVLEPADYGVVDVSLTFALLVCVFVTVGIDTALNAHFYSGDADRQRDMVTTAIAFAGACGLVVAVVIIGAAAPLARLLFKDTARSTIFYLLAINIVSAPIYSVVNTGLRLKMDIKRVNISGLSLLALIIGLNAILVLGLHMKATGVVAANITANALACGIGLILCRDLLRGRISLQVLKPLLLTGLSLVPGGLSLLLLSNADRLLLTQFVAQSDIGLYSIANKLGNMVYLLLLAAWTAWWPMALEMADKPDAPHQYGRMFEYFAAAAMLFSLAIGAWAPDILAWFTRSAYVPAARYALVLTIFYGPITAANNAFQITLYGRKRTHWISISVIAGAVVNIGLNLLLNPHIGVWGAVWASVIAGVVMAGIAGLAARSALPVPYRWPRLSVLLAVYLGLIMTLLLAPTINSLISHIVAPMVLLVAVLATGVVTRAQVLLAVDSVRYRLLMQAMHKS
jgi:O-antigen/teichoic acid export membrane protein